MITVKKITAISLLTALAFVTACSNGNQASGPANTGGAKASAAPGNDGPLTKYPAPVDVTTYSVNNTNFIQGEDINNNFWTKWNLDHLNINWVNKWTVDKEKADEKLNLAIASNDLPDVFEVNSLQQLQRLIKANQIEDLSAVYNKYALKDLKDILEFNNGIAFVPLKKNGKLYGLPVVADYSDKIAIMYIRTDWLKKLNLNPPKTVDELFQVAKAFVEQDPDGDGKKDTYGIAMNKNMDFPFDGIAASFNAYSKIWEKDKSGKLVYSSIQPEMKNALAEMQNMFKSGLFDPEFAVKDAPKVNEDIASGKVGIVFGPFFEPIDLSKSLDNNKNADWSAYSIPLDAQGKVVPKASPFAYNWIVVRKGFAHPEAAIKAMNLYTQRFTMDDFNEAYNTTHKGLQWHVNAKPAHFEWPNSNLLDAAEIQKAIATKDDSVITRPKAKSTWETIKKGGDAGWFFTKIYNESERVLPQYKQLKYSEFIDAPTPSMVTKQPTLDKLENETFTQIIMGAPLSNFDSFVDKWHKLGGDDITNEVNDWAKNR